MSFHSTAFQAIEHLIQGLPSYLQEKVWTEEKGLNVQFLLDRLPTMSRGEAALVETALTIYNGGEYLNDRGNILRHITEHCDTPTQSRIMRALIHVMHLRPHAMTLNISES